MIPCSFLIRATDDQGAGPGFKWYEEVFVILAYLVTPVLFGLWCSFRSLLRTTLIIDADRSSNFATLVFGCVGVLMIAAAAFALRSIVVVLVIQATVALNTCLFWFLTRRTFRQREHPAPGGFAVIIPGAADASGDDGLMR